MASSSLSPLIPNFEAYRSVKAPTNLLNMKRMISEATEDEKGQLIRHMKELHSSDTPLDHPKGGEVFKGGIREEEKLELAKAQAFFNESDKKSDTTKVDVVDRNADIVDDNPQTVAPEMADITIDNPEELKKKREPFKLKQLFSEEGSENVEPEEVKTPEAPMGKLEELQLKAQLKEAVDQYIEIMAQVVKLQNDLESKGGIEGEIPRVKIIDVLEDPRLHDPRVPSSVKSRLLEELNRQLKGQDTKAETEEYEAKIKEIEPAKIKVSDLLENLLSKTLNIDDVEQIRNSMASLVVKDDVTGVHKQEWDVACITREDEITTLRDKPVEISKPEEPVVSESVNQLSVGDKEQEKPQADQPEAKKEGGIIVGSQQLAKENEEQEQDKSQADQLSGSPIESGMTASSSGAIASSSRTEDSASGVKSEDIGKVNEEPKGDNDVSGLFDSKPLDDAPKKAKPNIYEEIATESATAAAEGSEVTEGKPKESSNVVAPPVPAEPLVKTDAINEFVDIDETGTPISADPVEHKEVDLNAAKEGLSAKQLADLTGKRDENVKGVVNLKSSDLIEKVELPKHSDKKAQIQARLAELRNQTQAEVDSDIFGKDTDVVTDITGRSLNETAVATNISPKKDKLEEKDIISEPETEDATSTKDGEGTPASEGIREKIDESEATPPERGIPTDDGEKTEPETVKEAETPKDEILDTSIPAEIGPDLSAEVPKKAEIAQPAPSIEIPKKTKKAGLWQDFSRIIGLNKKPTFTTDEIHDAEVDIMNKRSNKVEDVAEIAEQKK